MKYMYLQSFLLTDEYSASLKLSNFTFCFYMFGLFITRNDNILTDMHLISPVCCQCLKNDMHGIRLNSVTFNISNCVYSGNLLL